MGKSAVLSGLLHLAIVLLAIFGLPWLYEPNEVIEATPIAVISDAQFDQLKNAKKPPAQKQKKPDQPKEALAIPPAPKAPDLPEPVVAPEPAPEATPAPQPEPPPAPQAEAPPPPAPEPPPPAPPPPEPATPPTAQDQQEQQAVIAPPEPTPPPEPAPIVPQEPQQPIAQAKPLPPQKPKPPKKKEAAKKDKPKDQPVAESDDSFLKNLEAKLQKKQAAAQQQQAPKQEANLPNQDYDGPPLTEGEKDLIRQQIEHNWLIDAGMQGLDQMTVDILVQMNPDGSVQQATIDDSTNNGGPNWRIMAESARRAVYKSSPLRMPPNKPYEAWAKIRLHFDPKEMLGL